MRHFPECYIYNMQYLASDSFDILVTETEVNENLAFDTNNATPHAGSIQSVLDKTVKNNSLLTPSWALE